MDYSLPSNQYFAGGLPDIVAADFNHDGKVDLAVVGVGPSSNVVYVLPGQGNGLFSSAIAVGTFPGEGSASYWGVRELLVGDFDGDTNADLFVLSSVGIGNGNNGSATPHILYGDGKFGFQDTKPIASTDEVIYRVGDLNSDGRSDLYMMGTGGLHTYYGQGNRTLASYVQSTIYGGDFSPMSMADFNDDGRNDLVAIDSNYTSTFLVFFLAGANPGEFEYQTWNIPNAQFVSVDATGTQSYPVVGDFNRDGKPDWAYMGHTASNGGTSIAYTGLNSTENGLWSDCDYPPRSAALTYARPRSSRVPR